MLPKERRDSGRNDLFRARLDQIVDMKHVLARLGRAIDWRLLEERCGAEFFRYDLPFDRSSMTRWRQRMGEEKLNALLQESLASAVRTGAAKPVDFTTAIVDTTVQPKAVAQAPNPMPAIA